MHHQAELYLSFSQVEGRADSLIEHVALLASSPEERRGRGQKETDSVCSGGGVELMEIY